MKGLNGVSHGIVLFLSAALINKTLAQENREWTLGVNQSASQSHTYQLSTQERPSSKWALENEKKYISLPRLGCLPKKIDFSEEFGSLKDQGKLGSCTAQAITLLLEYILKRNGYKEKLSPLYVYYNERKLTDSIDKDSGASLSDAIKAIKKYGACREQTWPYEKVQDTYKIRPPNEAYLEGKQIFDQKKMIHINLPHDINVIKSILSERVPILCGINVFLSAESTKVRKTGVIPLPSSHEKPMGSHAIMLVGYDDSKQLFKFANSWGKKWGDRGFGYIPYKFIMNNNPDNSETHTLPHEFWSTNLMRAKL